MQLGIKSYLSSFRVSRLDTYKGIDELTLDIWWKIHETGDVSLLIKNKFKLKKSVVNHCSDLWDDIRQQQLDAFGVPQDYSKYWDLKASIAIKELQYAITQKQWDSFILDLDKDTLAELQSRPKQSNIQAKSLVEKYWLNGNRIDPTVTTVEEYYNYVKLLEQQSANAKSN